jgi:hypothetical protein
MQIPVDTPIGFIGLLLLVVGLFLFLTGFNIVKVQKVTVKSGRSTWLVGLVFFLLGIVLVILSDPSSLQMPAGKVTGAAEPTPTIPSATALPSDAGNIPTSETQLDPYVLLAKALSWPLTESESFDDPDPAWNGFGTYSDDSVQHNMRFENGRLVWGIKPLVGGIWYWQSTPYYSYSDFYLSMKAKRIQDVKNHTEYGLFFRKLDDRGYMFRIDDRQYFSVYLYDFDNWTPLIDWEKNEIVRPGEFNELTVIAEGPVMTFYINGTYVGTVTDSSLIKGKIAIMVTLANASPELVFEFDDFELREKP